MIIIKVQLVKETISTTDLYQKIVAMLYIDSSDTFNLTVKKNTDNLILTYKKEASKK